MNKTDKKRKPHNTFRGKLILGITSLTVFLVLAVALISYQLADRKIEEMAVLQSSSNLTLAESSLDAFYKEIENWSTDLLQDPTVRTVAENPETPTPVIHNLLYMKVLNSTSRALGNSLSFPTLGLYLANGERCLVSGGSDFPFSSFDECLRYLDLTGEDADSYQPAFLTLCPVSDPQSGTLQRRLIFVRFLYERFTMRKLGILAAEIDNASVFEQIGYLSDRSLLIFEDGTVAAAKDAGRIGTAYDNVPLLKRLAVAPKKAETLTSESGLTGDAQVLSCCPVFGDSCYLIAPFDYYLAMNRMDISGYLQSVLILILVSLLAAVLFAVLLSNRLSSQIQRLTTFVKHIYSGQFGERYQPDGTDEIAYLGEKINDMLDRIETSAKEREIDLKKQQIMELKLMQSQINPHLLYNTLDSVLWAIQNGNTENATELIASLSGFFRIALSRGVERIPLEKEVKLIETYVTIQRLARGQNVTLIKEIPEELLGHSIIKLTLQPLVENAYLHGFSGYRDDGTIRISARAEGNILFIEVQDNGIGMLPEEVETVNSGLKANTIADGSRSVGLYNVNRRIIHEYGREYGLSLESEVSDHTTVIVKLPYCPDKPEE